MALAFGSLALAAAALWAPCVSASPRAARLWTYPFAVAVAAALYGGILDVRGVLVILLYAVACRAANRAAGTGLRVAAHVLMLALCAGLMLHVLPGFDNPQVISRVVLGPGAEPYTKYLNFDKAVAGLFLLGLYAPELVTQDAGYRRTAGLAWRFAVVVSVVIALSLALGYVRWDPKAPYWSPLWAVSILCFTALPEEALFRGVVQTSLQRWLGSTKGATFSSIAIAGTLFGIAHLAGGPTYVVLAAVAGAGYGWIFAETRSIAAVIAAHTGLDIIHFLFFTYPAMALHG